MANNNLPAHDFAPAWLKIPTYDCHKPPGAAIGETQNHHHTSRKDDHWLIQRDREEQSSHSRYPFADPRWEKDPHIADSRKTTFFPSRHQSIDIDDGQYSSSSSSSGGSGSFYPSISALSNSNPSLHHRRPNSRQDGRDTNHHHHGKEVNSNGNAFIKKGRVQPDNNRSNGTTENNIDASSNNFNQEFPSLKGDAVDTKSDTPSGPNRSVWENPRNAKVHGVSRKVQLVHRPLKSELKEVRSKSPLGLSCTTSCISPKLNPQLTLVNQPLKMNGNSNQANMTVFRALIPAKRQTSPLNPPSQNMEILVKNPKMRGNKSEFLKGLRNEAGLKMILGEEEASKEGGEKKAVSIPSDNGRKNHSEEIEETSENAINIGKLSVTDKEDPSGQLLSSSLEAEQRLLREMGWKEDGSDDDAYAPLTEDELKEFQVLSEKAAQKRNGMQRNLQLIWSPKRVAPFPGVVLPLAENWSTSESDSDTD